MGLGGNPCYFKAFGGRVSHHGCDNIRYSDDSNC